MDHVYVEEADLVSRYLLHRLSADEEQAFEAHFVDCPACLDRLETTKRLREGLRTLATDAALRTSPPAARWPLALAAGLLLALGLAFAVARIVGLRGELAGLRQDLSRIEARSRDLERQAGDLQRRIAPDPPGTPIPAPGAGVPVVALSIVRGGSGAESGPAVQFTPPPAAPLVVLLLDLGSASAPSYRVAITNARGAQIWTGEHLTLTTPTELAVAIPSTLLQPGDYAVQVDGERRDAGPPRAVGHFAFRVR